MKEHPLFLRGLLLWAVVFVALVLSLPHVTLSFDDALQRPDVQSRIPFGMNAISLSSEVSQALHSQNLERKIASSSDPVDISALQSPQLLTPQQLSERSLFGSWYNLIGNGNFENGHDANWYEYPSNYVIWSTPAPFWQSGVWGAWVGEGNYDPELGYALISVDQLIYVPPDAFDVLFLYSYQYIDDLDYSGSGSAWVSVSDYYTRQYLYSELYGDADDTGRVWTFESASLTGYSGGVLDVYFDEMDFHNDEENSLYVDDVAVLMTMWDGWTTPGGATSNPVAMEEFDGRLYQAVTGSTSSKIWVRSTADGLFDGSDAGESWSDSVGGAAGAEPTLATFGNRLYISVKGATTGKIYTKSMSDIGVWDTLWQESGGSTSTAVEMDTFDRKLFQAIKGNTSNNIYMRYTSDGTFDGSAPGESWILQTGQTSNAIAMEVFGSRLYMSVRGDTGAVWIRSTSDGVFDDSGPGETFVSSGGSSSAAPVLANYGGIMLFQSVKGKSTNAVYTRYTMDGTTWTPWTKGTGGTSSRIGLEYFSITDLLYQTVRGASSSTIYMRTYPYDFIII
jgi:hypothetical protein